MGGSVSAFKLKNVQSLEGKVAIVTGGNVGIGFGIVKCLVSKGATVIIASRNETRVNEAVIAIKKIQSDAKVEGMVLDVSSFSSIDTFVSSLKSKYTKIDILINNAGIMMVPHVKTEQGFEVTLGTNVIGTSYLTNHLVPLMSNSESGGRIVFLSSALADHATKKQFKAALPDIGGEQLAVSDMAAYNLSKLLNSQYAYELQRRLSSHENTAYKNVIVLAADPGLVQTNIMQKWDDNNGLYKTIALSLSTIIAVPIETGALSSIYCATVEDIPMEMRGGTYSPGPKVKPYKWTTKAYTPENCRLSFDAVNSVIVSKGFQGFE